MVEKSGKRIMYDIRKMSETVKKLGRPLANDEIKSKIRKVLTKIKLCKLIDLPKRGIENRM